MRKPWSKIIEEAGVSVKIFERRPRGPLWREVKLDRVVSQNGNAYTRKDRKPLGHSDRGRAEEQAKALARALAAADLNGTTPDGLTLAQLRALYLRECGSLLSAYRQGEVRKAFRLFTTHLGEAFRVVDLGPHQVATYTAARQSGGLVSSKGRHRKTGVRAGTIAKELGAIHAALNWASTFRRNGRPLIVANPLRGVPIPSEPNPARPVATRERFDKLLEQANTLDGLGRFRMMLLVAWYTGRRLGSIVALRASDILMNGGAVQVALAAHGMDERLAEHWPAGIRWSAEADKEGVAWIVPIPELLRAELAAYIKARGFIGDALLFHAVRDVASPVSKETAFYWLRQAEQRAKLQHQHRGGWHALRRAWATARKAMPLQDVMAAGGWRDATSLQRAYQHSDPATVRAVMDVGT